MLKDFFHKKRKYATLPMDRVPSPEPGAETRPRREIPEGLMNKCPRCGSIQYSKEIEKNLKVCTSCQYHFKLTARERIRIVMDEGRLLEFDEFMVSEDPLGFPGYREKLAHSAQKTALREAVVTGEGTIGGFAVVVAVMAFEFFAASMGSVVGEKIARAIERAHERGVPLIVFSASGGARMQEGILSLMQMAKTSAALARFHEAGGLYISVITDPTYGGVSASFAMLGDIILAEPGAAFGFAGPVVIEQTIRQKLPDGFQKAEFNLEHGQLDMVVHRKDLRPVLIRLLDLHIRKGGGGDGGGAAV
ncbi:MAG: acetyl-CoA carboxylase subunit beta [Candidatus Reconcilbacillus cellulovorans]|uniref:Acetyl-coenzyme A carboxylase carboxyl transferase subunit beta n=1 Tax=Candidatus Reconcilbacillus cellulovorans TaxID=1906605 RepID=A0A2A6E3B1_9BACL|nr:MAG: acetyl-CoA carboxylase subunit beta [Candidatus Reconcilbacillus cellulovorans]